MKKIIILALVVLNWACQNSDQKLGEKDIASIRSLVGAYVSTALAGDWEGWGKTIAPDAIFCPPNQAPVEGREAIVAWGRTFPKLTSFTATATEILGYHDIVYTYGPYSLTAQLPDGSTYNEQGSHVDIIRKQSDGSWLYSRAIWHSNSGSPMAQLIKYSNTPTRRTKSM